MHAWLAACCLARIAPAMPPAICISQESEDSSLGRQGKEPYHVRWPSRGEYSTQTLEIACPKAIDTNYA